MIKYDNVNRKINRKAVCRLMNSSRRWRGGSYWGMHDIVNAGRRAKDNWRKKGNRGRGPHE